MLGLHRCDMRLAAAHLTVLAGGGGGFAGSVPEGSDRGRAKYPMSRRSGVGMTRCYERLVTLSRASRDKSESKGDSQGIGNLIQDADWARRPAWMGKPYSIDLRERVGAEIASGQSRRAAARRYDVSASFAVKLADRISQTGSAEPARQGRPPGGGKLAPYLAALLEWVEADPDITMPELAAKLEAEKAVTAHPASLSRVLLKAGLSFKKNTAGHGGRARGRAPGA